MSILNLEYKIMERKTKLRQGNGGFIATSLVVTYVNPLYESAIRSTGAFTGFTRLIYSPYVRNQDA
jgi:hypothetical protein